MPSSFLFSNEAPFFWGLSPGLSAKITCSSWSSHLWLACCPIYHLSSKYQKGGSALCPLVSKSKLPENTLNSAFGFKTEDNEKNRSKSFFHMSNYEFAQIILCLVVVWFRYLSMSRAHPKICSYYRSICSKRAAEWLGMVIGWCWTSPNGWCKLSKLKNETKSWYWATIIFFLLSIGSAWLLNSLQIS